MIIEDNVLFYCISKSCQGVPLVFPQDPQKSLCPFFIAAAQTQGRNLTFLSLISKRLSQKYPNSKFALEYNQDKLLIQKLP